MIPGAGHNPYQLADYQGYNAQGYDTSAYAGVRVVDGLTPFSAWFRYNIFDYGGAPQGMQLGDYSERLHELSKRFSNYGVYSTAATGASYGLGLAFTFPDIAHAVATGASAVLGGKPLGQGGVVNRAIDSALKFNPFSLTNKALMAPVNEIFASYIPSVANTFGEAVTGVFDRFGNLGTAVSAQFDALVEGVKLGEDAAKDGMLQKMARSIKSFRPEGAASGGKLAYLAQAGKLPFALASSLASFALLSTATDTVLQGGLNAIGVGIDVEQERISDTFEALSNRVLRGGSKQDAKDFAKEMAQEIRTRSFLDAEPVGLLGRFRIADDFMGRALGGWSALEAMNTKTAQYGLMAESGLLTKSSSAEEFINKADAMYAAISKLGEALGQTTTKAMETARVLKSQGISDPLGISKAGDLISTTAGISGYSHAQVMSVASEATEAFRGSLFSSDAAYGIANDVIRRTSLGQRLVGDKAYDKALFENRGFDSMNVNATRTMAAVVNSREMRQMLVASMYEQTDTGFRFSGSVNEDELARAASGKSFLTNRDALGLLNSNFAGLSQSQMREAERNISKFSSNLSAGQLNNLVGAIAIRHGYGDDTQGRQNMFDTIFRQQGMSPETAYAMAQMMTVDIREQDLRHSHFERREQRLRRYYEDTAEREGRTVFSNAAGNISSFLSYNKLFGRNTALVETAGLAATLALAGNALLPGAGAFLGSSLGSGLGLASGREYYQGVGGRISDAFGLETSDAADALLGYATEAGGTIVGGLAIHGLTKGVYSSLATSAAAKAGVSRTALTLGTRVPLMVQAVAPVTVGAFAGSYADKITQTWHGDLSAGKQMAVSSGYGGALGLGAGALLAPFVPVLATPVGLGVAAVAGIGAGLYGTYNRLFGDDSEKLIRERRELRQQMQVLQADQELREADPKLYQKYLDRISYSNAELMLTDFSEAAKILSDEEKADIYLAASEITAAHYADDRNISTAAVLRRFSDKHLGSNLVEKLATYRAAQAARAQDERETAVMGRGAWVTDRHIPGQAFSGINPLYGDPLPSTLTMKSFLEEKYQDKNLIYLDYDDTMLKVRHMISELPPEVSAPIISDLKNSSLGKKRFRREGGGAAGFSIYKFDDFFTGYATDPFTFSKELLDDTIKAATTQLASFLGAKEDEITKTGIISAKSSPAVFTLIDSFGTEDYAKAVAYAEKSLGTTATKRVDQLLRNKYGSYNLSEDKLAEKEDQANALLGNLALLPRIADRAIFHTGMSDFKKAKAQILGESYETVASYMRSVYSGGDEQLTAAQVGQLAALREDKFAGIKDRATKDFMLQTDAAISLLNAAPTESLTYGGLRSAIDKSSALDAFTKDIMRKQLGGRDDTQGIFADDLKSITKAVGQQLISSNLFPMTEETLESISKNQLVTLNKIHDILDKKFGVTGADAGKDKAAGQINAVDNSFNATDVDSMAGQKSAVAKK